tara:strand:- start:122 stop:355 length:234 start_codon:yes stop_codon:yes gene_type:complete
MWCQDDGEEKLTYIFQLQAKSIRLLNYIVKSIQGSPVGSGFDQKKEERILLIKKRFFSQLEYKNFISNFEYTIEKVK